MLEKNHRHKGIWESVQINETMSDKVSMYHFLNSEKLKLHFHPKSKEMDD